MPGTPIKHEFRCTSSGHQQLMRVLPRGCPVCHEPSPTRVAWGATVLEARAERRVAVRA
jgi:hypothetical protein